MPGTLRFENVTKRFGNFAAVDQVTLEIEQRKTFSLLGPTGCGWLPASKHPILAASSSMVATSPSCHPSSAQ